MFAADMLANNEGRDTSRMAVIDPSRFILSREDPDGIHDFDVWFTIDDDMVADSNLAVCLATPGDGLFVLYEIKGLKIDWNAVNGCVVRTYADGKIDSHAEIPFHGLSMRPKRCVTIHDSLLSRAVVTWHVRPSIAPTEPAQAGNSIDDLIRKIKR
jgi:hypothetical protein